ncbi:alpha/beta fold hydrolase [Nocardia sp. NPDC051570]|uniref:alpha/beta fold hydrolase n=1 Tax=Nocardia sp. NPDC051570 TaxID=3364324 RepID=UPI0037B29621
MDAIETEVVIVIVPAMGVAATYYRPLVERLEDIGINCVIRDLRGQGEFGPPPGRTNDFGFTERVGDLADLLAFTARVRPGAPIYVLGHSLGSHIGTLYTAFGERAGGPPLAGLITIAADSSYYSVFPTGGRKVLALNPVADALGRVLGRPVNHGTL